MPPQHRRVLAHVGRSRKTSWGRCCKENKNPSQVTPAGEELSEQRKGTAGPEPELSPPPISANCPPQPHLSLTHSPFFPFLWAAQGPSRPWCSQDHPEPFSITTVSPQGSLCKFSLSAQSLGRLRPNPPKAACHLRLHRDWVCLPALPAHW